ncbi:MarR family winged helix-turn-helix transcriptional regulator [Nonomuraea africana]|uniref:DNA-binding MarR family transcriptional regulator n=1 Tax=Nonomuraea africana TaxID=46171 RepID=A0ABR9KWP3_9ACTN|nr:MarR family winged helix-turn-helix transcriptional regulator [Nonomuraea africana]MBE1566433.1 DNA-binding MarR family transcriptional regulator [Nonomuraea africana]
MDDVERVEAAMVAVRRRQSRRALARLHDDVQGALYDVLDAVEAGSAVTVSSLAQALGVDQPRASRLVAAAVAEGLVRRQADQADGRRSVLVLTAAGREAAERAHRTRQAVFRSAMDGWTDAECAEFARLLTRFVQALPG